MVDYLIIAIAIIYWLFCVGYYFNFLTIKGSISTEVPLFKFIAIVIVSPFTVPIIIGNYLADIMLISNNE